MSTKTALQLAAAAVLAVLLGVLAGCTSKATSPAAASSAGAAASSAAAAASALKTSAAGKNAEAEAAQLADACKAQLGSQGYNAMAPGVPGAKAARKAFYGCEKIPRAKVFAWGLCLVRAYTSAPAKGPQGSAAEQARQLALTEGAGTCTATAKGIKLGSPAGIPSPGTANIPGTSPSASPS
jgi:hypothetical protein